jgi:HAD superfamily hydrolase (TIGR01509 family)
MNKAIIFDLDGVLIDSKEIHFNALNLALANVDKKYIISRNDQDTTFEGLTTYSKLNILTYTRGLPRMLHKSIWEEKQKFSTAMFSSVSADTELVSLIKYIRSQNILVGVASNSIRATLDGCLKALGIMDLVDHSLSNEDVNFPKPSPEIYTNCMSDLNVHPDNVIIFEDSEIGREAAKASEATLEPVESRASLTFDRIQKAIEVLNAKA